MNKPTTGKVTSKPYKCLTCGATEQHSTNHWGEIYPRCRSCGWKNPMEMGQTFVCLEACPDTHDRPKPWTRMRLGDVLATERGHGGYDDRDQT